tara:strand:- start:371 stop:1414 length:1044 start_codon:yes stop_codon:yes gene_type:complete
MKFPEFFHVNRSKIQAHKIYNQRIAAATEVYDLYNDKFLHRNCPACGSKIKEHMPKFLGKYEIVSCSDCSMIYTSPCPSNEALDYYYNNTECNKSFVKILQQRALDKKNFIFSERGRQVEKIFQELLSNKDKISILEIGCSSGMFLAEVRHMLESEFKISNVNIFGIDIDRSAISQNVEKKNNLLPLDLKEFKIKNPSLKFDVIFHFELIEHLFNPQEFLSICNELLNADGKMFFHTPNVDGFDNKMVPYWEERPLAHSIFPPMHINSFSDKTIKVILQNNGFNVLKIETPGVFDSQIVRSFQTTESISKFGVDLRNASSETLASVQSSIIAIRRSSHMTVYSEKSK